ncbi:MAG: NAD-dependent succinate-semialdehyde dehydrogenase [Dissulfurispiraceae bacterium]
MKIQSINPYTNQVIKEFDKMTEQEIEEQIDNSRNAFSVWRKSSVSARSTIIKKLSDILRTEKQRLAVIITSEMGKPVRESLAEIEKCAWLCDYYAETATRFLRPEKIKTESKKSYIVFQPLGIVLSIMPWNFPFWQVFRCAIPAIIAGNCCLLKHASNVPMCAVAIEELFRQAGFPENVFKALLIDASAAMKIIDMDRVDAVSLTGSNKAGEQVGALAGGRIKKVVLELGGSDPFVVLDDADIEKTAGMAARARVINAGQSCIAAKRFIVMEKILDQFKNSFVEQLKALRIGDPMDESTDIGPLSKREILDSLNDQLEDAKAKGAEVLRLGDAFQRGLFFPPCVVLNATEDMRILTEEVFGPIAPIIPVKNVAEAIRRANSTKFGLGASIWSRNLKRAEKIAMEIEAGFVSINDMVKSDPRLPFGGIKKSGLGRELSHYGLKEFVNVKSVVVRE